MHDATTDLSRARVQIDEIDAQMVALLGRRAAICRETGESQPAGDGAETSSPPLSDVNVDGRRLAADHGLDAHVVSALFEVATRSAETVGAAAAEPTHSLLASSAVRIDHVAIAVRDLDQAIATYRDTLGFELVERRAVRGAISGMDSAVMEAGPITFVLVQGDSPESNVSRYIEHYGPGVQHVALEVRDPERLVAELGGRGCDLLTGVIHSPGLDQVFTKREPNSGIQLELVTRVARTDFAESNVQQLFEAMERENVY